MKKREEVTLETEYDKVTKVSDIPLSSTNLVIS